MSGVYKHPRGANLSFAAQWKDANGVPIDLTGVTLTPFEIVPAALAPSITATVTDPSQGKFTVACPWSSAWPDGTGPLVTLRFQPSNGGPLSVKIPVQLE